MHVALLVAGFTGSLVAAATDYVPQLYQVGTNVTSSGLQKYSNEAITLDNNSPIVTLDYGHEVSGWPFVEISGLDEPVQIELKYSEPYAGLSAPQGDGPWYNSILCLRDIPRIMY